MMKEWTDPIVEEVRAAGDELARECQYDLKTLCDRLRRGESRHKDRIAPLTSIPFPPPERSRSRRGRTKAEMTNAGKPS